MTCTHRYDGNANDCDICIDITMGFDPIEPVEAFNEFNFPDDIHHEFFNRAVETFDNYADKWCLDASYRIDGPSDRTNVLDYISAIESFMAQLYATRPFMGNEGPEIRTSLLKEIIDRSSMINTKRFFNSEVLKELIAEAMHPRRMMKRMNQFEDFEDFFNNI